MSVRTHLALDDIGNFSTVSRKAVPRFSEGKGRGLFALSAVAPGELLDCACTVEISPEQCLKLDKMQPLGDFYFAHPEDEQAGLMVLGLPSLCNHADDPNADVVWRHAPGLGWMACLVALKPIAPDEEITYRYRCPLWFDPAA